MKLYGQVENAQFENWAAAPTAGVIGRFGWNTTSLKLEGDDGTNFRSFLRNDGKAIFGNSGTASDNIRFHRGAVGVLQLVTGNDTTSEGILSTNLNSLSFKLEAYTFAGRPANGNPGRLIYVSDRTTVQVDSGTAWLQVGSSGGGGTLQWIEDLDAPLSVVENGNRVYLFDPPGVANVLYTLIRVPNGYVAGSQISLRLVSYTSASAGATKLETVATLVRTGTDVISSTTNQRSSTNTAIAWSGATVNKPQAIVFDLSSASGQINGVAVSPGDLIKVKMDIATDSSGVTLRVPVFGAEVNFS